MLPCCVVYPLLLCSWGHSLDDQHLELRSKILFYVYPVFIVLQEGTKTFIVWGRPGLKRKMNRDLMILALKSVCPQASPGSSGVEQSHSCQSSSLDFAQVVLTEDLPSQYTSLNIQSAVVFFFFLSKVFFIVGTWNYSWKEPRAPFKEWVYIG